jgi:hypothetical protein
MKRLLPIVFLAGCSTGMPIPDVENHAENKSLLEVQNVCEVRVEKYDMPCAVVTTGNKVCYAYMYLDGSSDTVHCFVKGGG